MDLLIKTGSLWQFDDGAFSFHSERPGDMMLFRKEGTAADKWISEGAFKNLLGTAGVFEINYFKSHSGENEVPQPCNDNEVFGPDEENSPAAIRARSFQFYVRKWDAEPAVGVGRKELTDFIERWRGEAAARGHTHPVKPARLHHAIKHCGEPGKRPLYCFRSRRGKSPRKRFADFVVEAFQEAANAYWSDPTWDYNDAYALFRRLMREENERRAKIGDEPLKFPARMETLRRRINLGINHANWARKYGKRVADLKFNGVSTGLGATRPLELVLMDHTIVDTWTVIDTATYIPFKQRATLTLAIDLATRMPLGHLLSFEKPSLYSVMTTLKRVNKPKDYIARVFTDIQGTWDGWGHPEAILVDNGLEFTSPSLQDALDDIGTEVIWAPVRTPQYKAVVERFFNTLNTMLFKKLKGGVPYDPVTMRQLGMDPSKDAIISLGDLDRLIHIAIIAYQKEPHSGMDDAIPAVLWREKIRRHGRRFIPDIRQMNSMLGRVDTGVLTKSGITFKNMTFHDQHITTKLLDDLAGREPKRNQTRQRTGSLRAKVKFKYNPADVTQIQVWNDGAKPRHYVTLPNRSKRFSAGISFWQAAEVRDHAIKHHLQFETDEDKWRARDHLRQEYDRLAGKTMRELKDARRSVAQTMGTYDDADTDRSDATVKFNDVAKTTTAGPTDGFEQATLVPSEPPAHDRSDSDAPPAGFKPTSASKAKAKVTRAANRDRKNAEAAAAKAKQKNENQGVAVKPESTGAGSFKQNLKSRLSNQKGWKKG